MPELPEVDLARSSLMELIPGRRILSAKVLNADAVGFPGAEEFSARLSGQRFTGVRRRGKFLFLLLASGDTLTVHFRMTGFLLFSDREAPLDAHTHIIFSLDGGKQLRFIDPRRFGRIWLTGKGESDVSGAEALGPEPDDAEITGKYLKTAFHGRKSAVKTMLMDQHIVAGIGNIYSAELLFQAQIHPARPAHTLTETECKTLAFLIPRVMAFYTQKNKLPPMEYMAGGGREYGNTPYLQVYGRAGKACARCGTALESMNICGRGSVFCPRCTPFITDGKGR